MPEHGSETLKDFLLLRHTWYCKMQEREEWPTMRAVLGGLNNEDQKTWHLVKTKLEKKEHWLRRIRLSQFLGAAEGIVGRITSAVFKDTPHVTYDDSMVRVEEWAGGDVDGRGHTMNEWMDETAPEALGMGQVGTFVDLTGDPTAPRGGRDDDIAAGIDARLIRFRAEEITNWGEGADGEPEFVVLERRIKRQDAFDVMPGQLIEWIVLNRETVSRFEAAWTNRDVTIDCETETFDKKDELKPRLITKDDIGDVVDLGRVEHGCGCVPFAPLYGGRIEGLLRGKSLMQSTGRADIATFNADSSARWSRHMHLIPLLVVKTAKQLEQVFRSDGIGVHLAPEDGEDVKYESTDAAAFSTALEAVREDKREAFRQSGSDPDMMIDSRGGGPESGEAKRRRFNTTEGRVLGMFSRRMQEAHRRILDIVARRLVPRTPQPAPGKAFEGTVQYPKSFDIQDAEVTIRQYDKASKNVNSITWHREMLKRIALSTLGDAPAEVRAQVTQEMDDMKDEEIQAIIAESRRPDPMTEPSDATNLVTAGVGA